MAEKGLSLGPQFASLPPTNPLSPNARMELPILSKLRDGVRFDFNTLADCDESTDAYWEEWWDKADPDAIGRPEIIEDGDPILLETIRKETVDLVAYHERFNKFLSKAIERNWLPAVNGLPRDEFHERLLRIVASNSRPSPERPQIIFAGGGYGSGKTTVLTELAKAERIPVGPGHLVGVDYFKLHVPEFSLIQSVGDGRASGTVQKECKALTDRLFPLLIENRRSFVWDSSMSNREESLQRIRTATGAGYELTLVAVLTPLKLAIRQAMQRAKLTRRFPNREALPESNGAFKAAFREYVPLFDEVIVFARMDELGNVPVEVATKSGKANQLASPDGDTLTQALAFGASK